MIQPTEHLPGLDANSSSTVISQTHVSTTNEHMTTLLTQNRTHTADSITTQGKRSNLMKHLVPLINEVPFTPMRCGKTVHLAEVHTVRNTPDPTTPTPAGLRHDLHGTSLTEAVPKSDQK